MRTDVKHWHWMVIFLMFSLASPSLHAFSCKNDSRAQQETRYCLACNFYHEAGTMNREGRRATGYSVINRAHSRHGGVSSICGQIWMRNSSGTAQYSWTMFDRHDVIPNSQLPEFLALADEMLAELDSPELLAEAARNNPAVCATHYHTRQANIGGMGNYPCWSAYSNDSSLPGYNPNCGQQQRVETANRMIRLNSPSGDAHLYQRDRTMQCYAEAEGVDPSLLYAGATDDILRGNRAPAAEANGFDQYLYPGFSSRDSDEDDREAAVDNGFSTLAGLAALDSPTSTPYYTDPYAYEPQEQREVIPGMYVNERR